MSDDDDGGTREELKPSPAHDLPASGTATSALDGIDIEILPIRPTLPDRWLGAADDELRLPPAEEAPMPQSQGTPDDLVWM